MQTVKIHLLLIAAFCLLMAVGCGAAVQKTGTEQLVLSDSVDRAIDQLDLSPLAGRTVFLDTAYMQTYKGPNVYVNSDYIVSALRQKMTTTGCQLELNRTEADYILEARVGALGTDTMEVTYGIPSSNGLGAAATALSGVPAVPAIPEISVGKRNNMMGVSKIVVFAYHRDTGIPVWQSGAAVARSDAKDSWFLGVGPLTRGSVYNGVTLAGNRVNPPFEKKTVRQVKPLTMADRHSYVHPAVLEKQLADAKELESQQKSVQQAEHIEGTEGHSTVEQAKAESTATDAGAGTAGDVGADSGAFVEPNVETPPEPVTDQFIEPVPEGAESPL